MQIHFLGMLNINAGSSPRVILHHSCKACQSCWKFWERWGRNIPKVFNRWHVWRYGCPEQYCDTLLPQTVNTSSIRKCVVLQELIVLTYTPGKLGDHWTHTLVHIMLTCHVPLYDDQIRPVVCEASPDHDTATTFLNMLVKCCWIVSTLSKHVMSSAKTEPRFIRIKWWIFNVAVDDLQTVVPTVVWGLCVVPHISLKGRLHFRSALFNLYRWRRKSGSCGSREVVPLFWCRH